MMSKQQPKPIPMKKAKITDPSSTDFNQEAEVLGSYTEISGESFFQVRFPTGRIELYSEEKIQLIN